MILSTLQLANYGIKEATSLNIFNSLQGKVQDCRIRKPTNNYLKIPSNFKFQVLKEKKKMLGYKNLGTNVFRTLMCNVGKS